MAPADDLSAPGTSIYSSSTMTVGDGTWDFTKNTFLLPNLQGLNFETMQYNGMGNRFSTDDTYRHRILAHGVLAAVTFLLVVPVAVFIAKFSSSPHTGRNHGWLTLVAVALGTAAFALGVIAVGPSRALTNPHHGIGVALYTMLLFLALTGCLVPRRVGHSLRQFLHRWLGNATALLGLVQVVLGMTLYGSPKYLFILYAIWTFFLLMWYMILAYRDEGRRDHYLTKAGWSRYKDGKRPKSESSAWAWLLALGAGLGVLALLGGKKSRDSDEESGRSRSQRRSARSRSYSRSLSRSSRTSRAHTSSRIQSAAHTDVTRSGRDSVSRYYDEKTVSPSRRQSDGGGFMTRMLGVVGALGAGALAERFIKKRRDKPRPRDEEYSAVATDTPSKLSRAPPRLAPGRSEVTDDFTESTVSELTEDIPRAGYPPAARPGDRREPKRSPLGPGGASVSAVESTARPMTPPRASHPARGSRYESTVGDSDYSSYISPSQRTPVPTPKTKENSGGGVGKGLLAGLGLGWLAKKMQGKKKDNNNNNREDRPRDEQDRRRDEEDSRRGGRGGGSTYTGSPRQDRRRWSGRPPPPPSGVTTDLSAATSDYSSLPPRGGNSYTQSGGTISTGTASAAAPGPSTRAPPPYGGGGAEVRMPPMPDDPRGVLAPNDPPYESGRDPLRRNSLQRRREGEAAAAAAAEAATILAAEEESRRRKERGPGGGGGSILRGGQPVSVKVKVQHDDRDRNVTLRRLTDEEARREDSRRRRAQDDSISSLSDDTSELVGGPTGGGPSGGGAGGAGGAGAGASPGSGGGGGRYDSGGGGGGGRRYRRDRSSSARRPDTASREYDEPSLLSQDPPERPRTPPASGNRGGATGYASQPQYVAGIGGNNGVGVVYGSGQGTSSGGGTITGPAAGPEVGGTSGGGGGAGGGAPASGDRGRDRQKDSAYYSGQVGSGGLVPPPGLTGTMSSLDNTSGHGTWSEMSQSPSAPTDQASAAADRRRRRRQERRGSSVQPSTMVDFD